MELAASLIQPGWEIYSSDGQRVGTVSSVAEDHLEMELEVLGSSSVAIPFESVTAADGGRVELDVSAAEVGEMHWEPKPADGG